MDSNFKDVSAEFQMGTLDTVAEYISDARTLLQDVVAPYRYDDPSLLMGLNTTILEARRLRPDLFIYHHKYAKQTPSFSAVDDTIFEIEPEFRLAFVYGLVAHALMRDQEDIEDVRASSYMSAFNSMLIGRGAAAIITPLTKGGGQPPPAAGG